MKKAVPEKVSWQGEIISIQPRTTVWRYLLDNRTHYQIGYNLFLKGTAGQAKRRFSVAISEKQQDQFSFGIGDLVTGTAWTKLYKVSDYADYYRAAAFKVSQRKKEQVNAPPPYLIKPLSLADYGQRGARLLDPVCYRGKCFSCAFATMAAVAIEYNWGASKRHRFESFCYGPFSCAFYQIGQPRPVPYKDSETLYDTGWLDELCTSQRGPDEWENDALDQEDWL